MAIRSTLTQVVQLFPETTQGTAGAATKRLQGLMVTPQIKPVVNQYRSSGSKMPNVTAIAKESMEAKLAGTPTFGELPYLLSSVFAKTTPTPLGSQGGQKWIFAPSTF